MRRTADHTIKTSFRLTQTARDLLKLLARQRDCPQRQVLE
jgi:hypothetical protein